MYCTVRPWTNVPRDARVDRLRAAAERLGLGWGGVEKGGIVRVYFGDGLYTIRGLRLAERVLAVWREWSDKGDMQWYWWVFALANYPREQCLEAYHRLVGDWQELAVGA